MTGTAELNATARVRQLIDLGLVRELATGMKGRLVHWDVMNEPFYTVEYDFRLRKAIQLLEQRVCEPVELDNVARDTGLSRPHFYKLFRQQVGVTPNIYLNSLRMEQAIERLTKTTEAVAAIGLDLGFSSQASFSRFFIANGVVPPSAYRRSAQIAYAQ